MTLLQQCKLFVFCINMHLPRIGRHLELGGHFESCINFYKSEIFLMHNKIFVDSLIGSNARIYFI